MTPERVFEWASVASLCGWAGLLIGAACPMGVARRRLLAWGGRVVPLALAAGYVAMLVAHWGSGRPLDHRRHRRPRCTAVAGAADDPRARAARCHAVTLSADSLWSAVRLA